MTRPRSRRPEGTPTGGQFAPEARQEADGTDALAADPSDGTDRSAHPWPAITYYSPRIRTELYEEELEALEQAGVALEDTRRWPDGTGAVNIAMWTVAGVEPDDRDAQDDWIASQWETLADYCDAEAKRHEQQEPEVAITGRAGYSRRYDETYYTYHPDDEEAWSQWWARLGDIEQEARKARKTAKAIRAKEGAGQLSYERTRQPEELSEALTFVAFEEDETRDGLAVPVSDEMEMFAGWFH